MMKITVKELMEEKKAVDLMTPGGFVYLTAEQVNNCLLYTSDAADEEDSVDLGGARSLKKKKKKKR